MTDSLVSAAAAAAADAETAISVKLRHIKLCADQPTRGHKTAAAAHACKQEEKKRGHGRIYIEDPNQFLG